MKISGNFKKTIKHLKDLSKFFKSFVTKLLHQ